MSRYKIIIQYDGTNFSGFQSQKNLSGIQDKIESSIFVLNNNKKVKSINLEVYQEMAHKQFEKIINKANLKWKLEDSLIIHRYGKLKVNSKIVLVACFSKHRLDSFESCNFIMDYLKKDAPFWKNEFYGEENEWLSNFN